MTATLANAGAVDRSSTDFYPTPPDVTEAFLKFFEFHDWGNKTIWEPAAGEGHMADVFEKRGFTVSRSDLYSYTHENFLDIHELRGEWIVTNPPFKHAEAFIRHALDLKPRGVAMLLKSQYWHAASRLKLFTERPPSFVLPLTWRPDFLFGKKSSAPTMEVLWTVWAPLGGGLTFYQPLPRPEKGAR